MSTRYLVGVDDTDNLESRGTGHRARQLGDLLGRSGMHLRGVTRHQLFVSPAIPYTSHNSAACLEVQSADESATRLIGLCRDFVRADSAPGSDAGICIGVASSVAPDVADFGARAKHLVLDMTEAETLARQNQLHLEPLTGTGLGIIGALAAVGLRARPTTVDSSGCLDSASSRASISGAVARATGPRCRRNGGGHGRGRS